MIYLILFIGVFILFAVFPKLRCFIVNLPISMPYGIGDLLKYVRRRGWRVATAGELNCYCGLFGKGKTLSAVHDVRSYFHRYNGKRVWDPSRNCWVLQQVVILSNIHLNDVPYIHFQSLQQMCKLMHENVEYDKTHDTLTYLYVLGDEFSVQMNSRNFKSNLDPFTLNSILTCRHYRTSLVMTSQRFSHLDALLRQVTQNVYICDKSWRLCAISEYDAFSLENAANPDLIKPLFRSCWFVRNKDYAAYDTLACVDNLEHSSLIGDTLSSSEILNNLCINSDPETVTRLKKKYKNKKKIS